VLSSENPDDRVMVFIDLANVQKAVRNKENNGFQLDYYRLVNELAGPRRLIGAYIFDAVSVTDHSSFDPRRRLHDALRFQGFRVIAREVNYGEEGEQKEVDVALATELVANALRNAFDVAIIVSGDRDFVPAVERVRMEGKGVEAAFFWDAEAPGAKSSFSQHLQRAADRVHNLDELPVLKVVAPNPEGSP
jgi:uncharacterized LabA/DUF88 family protein